MRSSRPATRRSSGSACPGRRCPTWTTRAPGAIRQVIEEVKRHGAKFVVCQVEPGVIDRPNEYGLATEVDGVYDFVEDVIAAYDKRGTAT